MGELISNIYNTGYSDSHMDEGRYYLTPYTTDEQEDETMKKKKSFITGILVLMIAGSVISIRMASKMIGIIKAANTQNSLYNEIEQNIAERDYRSAILRLTNCSNDQKRNEYRTTIINDALSYADVLRKNGEYTGAVGTLNDISGIVGSNDDIKNLTDAIYVDQIIANLDNYSDAREKYDYLVNAIRIYGLEDNPVLKNTKITCGAEYSDDINRSAAVMQKNGDYETAITILQESASLGNTAAEERIQDNRLELVKSKLDKISESDIPARIKYLTKAIRENNLSDIELNSYLNTISEAYCDECLINAENEYRTNGYKQAVAVIDAGLEVLPGNEKLLAAKKYYESLKPTTLVSLSPYSGYDLETYTTKDNFGDTHNDSLRVNCNCYEYDNSYKIKGKYKTLTMTLFVDEEFKGRMPNDTALRIYADGELVYIFVSDDDDRELQYVTVDIDGAQDLRVVLDRERGFGRHMIACEVMLNP